MVALEEVSGLLLAKSGVSRAADGSCPAHGEALALVLARDSTFVGKEHRVIAKKGWPLRLTLSPCRPYLALENSLR